MAHLYWRLNVTGGVTANLGELQMYDSSGTYLNTGGTATADDGTFGPASQAFDDIFNSIWGPSGAPPHWVQYQFASPVDVASFRITGRLDNHTGPTQFVLQYSDDGITFTDATPTYTPTMWDLDRSTWSFAVASAPPGAYLNWRVLVTAVQSTSTLECAELELRDLSGVLLTATTPLNYPVGSSNSGTFRAFQAFDQTPLTSWGTTTLPAWIGYAFNAFVVVAKVCWQIGSTVGNGPATSGDLQGSNDGGITWTTVLTIPFPTWTSAFQNSCSGLALPIIWFLA